MCGDKMLFDYDDRDAESIYEYAKKLENMTFNQVLEEFEKSNIKQYINLYDLKNAKLKLEDSKASNSVDKTGNAFIYTAKGQLGDLIERFYFGYAPNSNQEVDFEKAGMELKVTPIDKKKNGGYRAGERLSITNISYDAPVEEDFFKSHVYKKIECILLIQYIRDKSIDRLDYIIKFVNKFKPLASEEDKKIIIDDYKTIINKIKQGKAHELSESDTLYLGASTKGSTAASSWRPQYYGSHEPAKKRNFCLKVSYMDYVLQNYVMPNKMLGEKIIKESIGNLSFEDYIIDKIKLHIGLTDKELCKKYNREYNNNKAQWNDLTFRMLGIKSNQAEEFVKANIVVKTIRIEKNGKNKESMSFPTFKFKELVKEKWEESTIYNYFETTKFLFVVFTKKENEYELSNANFWNMPYNDLNLTVKDEWLNIQSIINEGVKFSFEKNKDNLIVKNNLPGIADSKILHVRPHATKSAYRLKNGFTRGNVERDANELPNGEWMTTQSFWINSNYVLSQIKL